MKSRIITLLALFCTLAVTAQKAINYKALIKDNLGNVVVNQNITIEFSILEGPEIGFLDPVYIETHTVITDANGIVIANIGEGNPDAGYEDAYETINWGSFFGSHFLKVQIDTGSGLTDMGTTEFKAVPYALYAESSNNSGLEAINEGNGTGRRLIGMNPENYGPIANFAVDLSYSPANSTTRGATGDYAAALGYQTTASGYSSFASGVNTEASGTQATAMGAGTVASGHSSVAMGNNTTAEAPNTTAIGLFNVGGGDPLLASATDPLFEIGNGQYVDGVNDVRTNALTVLRNGTITAPTFDILEITDPKALITKEYADANYSGGGTGTSSTGLEALDEGNGSGWRLVGNDPNNYGNIGNEAVDLSINNNPSTVDGATGSRAVAMGFSTEASGPYALATGYNTEASGEASTAMGLETEASGDNSIAFGNGTSALGENALVSGELSFATGKNASAMGNGISANALSSTALGLFNEGGGDPTTWVGTDPVFEIGNGTDFGNKSNALTVLKNGTIMAPTFDMAEITAPKALITKEYADANYSGGGTGTAPTGLEAIDEGNGNGWRLIGTDPANYGNIGSKSVDLSFSGTPSTTFGPTGSTSITAGTGTTASGDASVAFGAGTIASGPFSLSVGYYTTASGNSSTALGSNTIADDSYSTVVGRYNNETELPNVAFQVGNGTSSGSKSNALNVTTDGIITAPSLDIGEITDSKTLITKEYADANLSASGLETLDEGNGQGHRLVGADLANYGDIGNYGVDLSHSFHNSSITGATGYLSVAMGYETMASELYSTAMGNKTRASGGSSTAMGDDTLASGIASTALGKGTTASGMNSTSIGRGTIADDDDSTVVGVYNDNTVSTTTLFQVGNGDLGLRSNAFSVLQNGKVLAPSLDIGEITDSKALITKEYADANLSSTGLEAIDEGNGTGWRLTGADPTYYGNIGSNAIDLSISEAASSTIGATGIYSIAIGRMAEASGNFSTALGWGAKASGYGAIAIGSSTLASGEGSVAMCSFSQALGVGSAAMNNSDAGSYYSSSFGYRNISGGTLSSWVDTDPLFEIGNGFGTIPLNALTVLKNGYMAVGTHDVLPTTDFQINHDNDGTLNGLKLQNKGTNENWWRFYTLNSNGQLYLYSKAGGNASPVGSFDDASGAYTALSDRRAKANFKDLYFNWQEFMQLQPLTYHYKTDENKKSHIGFVAQDVESIYPELVNHNKEDDLYQLNYSGFGVVAIKAIQELKKENEQLKALLLKEEQANAEQSQVLQALLERVEALEKDKHNENAVIASATKQSQQ